MEPLSLVHFLMSLFVTSISMLISQSIMTQMGKPDCIPAFEGYPGYDQHPWRVTKHLVDFLFSFKKFGSPQQLHIKDYQSSQCCIARMDRLTRRERQTRGNRIWVL
jgi:hypothetical protein